MVVAQALCSFVELPLSHRLEPDKSPISEVLNVLWAMHEIISSTTSLTLDFFEEHTAKS